MVASRVWFGGGVQGLPGSRSRDRTGNTIPYQELLSRSKGSYRYTEDESFSPDEAR